MRRPSTKLWITLAVSAAALAIAAGASAYFQASGAGAATAAATSLAGPTAVTASASGVGAVSVAWTAPTPPGGGAVAGYYVQRFTGGTPTPACGSSATSLLSPSVTTCSDTGSPSGTGIPAGSYTYEVFAVWRSWSTPSTASSAVTVQGPSVTSASPTAADQGATGATGARNLTVTNPDGDSATATGAFTVNPAPTVTSATPSAYGQGAANQTVTITGTGFINGAPLVASFSGGGITVNSTTFVSATQLTANITITTGATTGTRNLTITNGDGSTATKTSAFTVNAAPT